MLFATSTRAIWGGTTPYVGVVEMLTQLRRRFPVAVISNHAKPHWFDSYFTPIGVEFARIEGRQDGAAIRDWAKSGSSPIAMHRVVVLAASQDDVAMAKNSGSVFVSAGWGADSYAQKIGLKVERPDEVFDIVRLVSEWDGGSYFHAEGAGYTVDALCDASSNRRVSPEQQGFGQAVTGVVKGGAAKLNQLLAVATGSLMRSGLAEKDKLLWGVYPSSSIREPDCEVLSDFTHRLRTTVSRVHFAKVGEPLFFRIRQAPKRSGGESADRTNPRDEVETIRLNPFYKTRVRGKNVVVLDDFTTHGVSMGVAAGFLRKAGAASVTGITLGKFGNCLKCYDIQLTSSPFAAVASGQWSSKTASWDVEEPSSDNQSALRELLEL